MVEKFAAAMRCMLLAFSIAAMMAGHARASTGSPWTPPIAPTFPTGLRARIAPAVHRARGRSPPSRSSRNHSPPPFAREIPDRFQDDSTKKLVDNGENGEEGKKDRVAAAATLPPRGGQDANALARNVGPVVDALVACGRSVLLPTVALARVVLGFYRALPKDAILAQVGLVTCFAGGYYPTLFSSLQAAQHCGWDVMVAAIQDLTNEAIEVVYALEDNSRRTDKEGEGNPVMEKERCHNSFRQKTCVILATVDPMKINQAAGALYTTWLGVSSVLEKEYARVITLSLTMARFMEQVFCFVLAPPAYMCIAADYHQWVPVAIGWGCKGLAMNIAWRIQRLMTAATSAMAGGLMFARACLRMLAARGFRFFGLVREDDKRSSLDEVIGFLVAGLGFYTQFETQWRSGFSFTVPWPVCLISWPFDFAERWIQWQITK